MIQKQITVNLGERSYPIYLGRDMVSSFAPTLGQHNVPKELVVITDSNVAPVYLGPLQKHLRHFGYRPTTIVVPPGEHQKSLVRAGKIFTEMLAEGIGRASAIVAMGGGVIGDLAGFVAATYLRGIPLVQMPTTLLAQIDSAVGGKVAVNHVLGKNMIGSFYQPVLVWADADSLGTLPYREIVCGIGEIVKYGVALDPELFSFLESNLEKVLKLEPESLSYVQLRCLELKSEIVARDEREEGLRSVLNLGHTVGHALESAGKYRLLKHGEAVLLGILAESYIARRLGMIGEETLNRIVALINRVPVKPDTKRLKTGEILAAIGRDKKTIGRANRFILSSRIGEVKVTDNVDAKLIRESLKYIRNLKRTSVR